MKLKKKALLITDSANLKETEQLKKSLLRFDGPSYAVKLVNEPSLEQLKKEVEHFFTENNKGNVHLLIYINGSCRDDSLAFIRIFEANAIYRQIIFFIDSPLEISLEISGGNKALICGSLFTPFLIEALDSEKPGLWGGNPVDINDIYMFIFNKMSGTANGTLLNRRICGTGIMPLWDSAEDLLAFNDHKEGWDVIKENETYSFFVLYLDLDFDIEKYKIDQLWKEDIEQYLFDPELLESSSWKKFFGNELSKKRIYISPVLNDNLPTVKSIFRIFLNKQIDDIRVTKKEIQTRYYFTTLQLPYKIVDNSERLIPSCSVIYKLAENLDPEKLYFSKDVIGLLPENMRKNLTQISHMSDLFTYTFNLIT